MEPLVMQEVEEQHGAVQTVRLKGKPIPHSLPDELQQPARSPELVALYQTAIDLANYHDLPALLQAIVERAVALIGAASGAIGIYDPAYEEIELTAQTGVSLPY